VIQAAAFYLFAVVVIASAVMTIASRNPVHSVLWLILAFLQRAGLFLLLGAEFIAMLLVIVYVGAVAVLFLFVVMMLDVDTASMRAGFARYLPFGALLAIILLAEIVFAIAAWNAGSIELAVKAAPTDPNLPNIQALGTVLYTRYLYLFEGAGLVLLGRDDRRDRARPTGPAAASARRTSRAKFSAGLKMRRATSIRAWGRG
jgi:NADH-quinone oxidoreductase subunit J